MTKAAANKRRLSQLMVNRAHAREHAYLIWDTFQHGLALQVRPGGHKSWKVIYTHHGRPRWYTLGNAAAISVNDARKLAGRIMFKVAEGADPQAERKAQRSKGTFEELATRYVNEYAQRKNKSWRQPDTLVRKHLLPRWGKLSAATITRSDVKALMAGIEAPKVANQTILAASAIFSWAIREEIVKVNPCAKIELHAVHSRERVLSDSEIPDFWQAFDKAGLIAGTLLKMILLTGQRPGEVAHMHREMIADGWWTLPGEPVPALNWPGTKSGRPHRVWLPKAAQELLADLPETGPLFVGTRGKTLNASPYMLAACKGLTRATPHDLRRTHGTLITALGFGRDAMNRIQNHADGGIASVYDRHSYAEENKRIMETVAQRIMALIDGEIDHAKVLPFRQA
jgi:integrase